MPHTSKPARTPRADTGAGVLLVLLFLIIAAGLAGIAVGVVSR